MQLIHLMHLMQLRYARNPMGREHRLLGELISLSDDKISYFFVLHHTRVCTAGLAYLSLDIIIPQNSSKPYFAML